METEVLSNPNWNVPLRKFPIRVFALDSSGKGAIEFAPWIPELVFRFVELVLVCAVAEKTTGCNFPRFSISNEVSFRDSLSNLFIIYILLFLHPVKQNKCLSKKEILSLLSTHSKEQKMTEMRLQPIFLSLYLDCTVVLRYGYLVSWGLEPCALVINIYANSFLLFQRNFPYTGDTSRYDTCASQYSCYENL